MQYGYGAVGMDNSAVKDKENLPSKIEKSSPIIPLINALLLGTGIALTATGIILARTNRRELVHPDKYDDYHEYAAATNEESKRYDSRNLLATRICLIGLASALAGIILFF